MNRPTLKQALDYYSRDDISSYIFEATRKHHVILVIPQRKHWKNDFSDNSIAPESREELLDDLRRRVRGRTGRRGENSPPPFYPSFHVSVRPTGLIHPGSGRVPYGYVVESDDRGWRTSFRAVAPAMAALCEKGVYFRCKYSGHRSLHVIVPFMAFPEKVRRYCVSSTWRAAIARLHQFVAPERMPVTHMLPDIVRLPYSLNEDTGRPSMPLTPTMLHGFQPEQATIGAITINEQWEAVPEEAMGSAAAVIGPRRTGPPPAARPLEYYLKHLTSDDPARRCEAATCLARFADESAAAALLTALGDDVDKVRRAAVHALRSFADHPVEETPIVTAFLESVRSDVDPVVRSSALLALRRFHSPRLREGIRIALADSVFQVRHRAIDILADMDLHAAAPEFEIAGQDPDRRIRRLARKALEGR